MVIKTMDAKLLQKIFLAGANAIELKKEYINDLNVFPVPDGDTGTNMTMTIMSAAKEVSLLENPTMEQLAKAISSGTLRGARGNSGVILSQLFRGFTKEIKDHHEITTTIMARAMQRGTDTAYRAVMKPKEGTILTVARGGAEKATALQKETDDLVVFFEGVIKHMREVLVKTPDLLPVLKEAGVVDSGGEGLLTIMTGMGDALSGKATDVSIRPAVSKPQRQTLVIDSSSISTADIKFGYCTEYIINVEKTYDENEESKFKQYLESIGDSIVVVSDDDVVKVHVHTNDPGLAIQKALTYGSITSIKIDNMREEHNEKVIRSMELSSGEEGANPEDEWDDDDKNAEIYGVGVKADVVEAKPEPKKEEPRKTIGFISVSVGKGLNEIFMDLGVDYIIEGGQTMNPSTEDMLKAIDKVNADTIFILPNNSNIILTAEQARDLTEDKNIVVIPSKTIPQGITAIINYMSNRSVQENTEQMKSEMKRVKSGQVTYAVRDTVIDGKQIRQGNIMGIGDKTILAVGSQVLSTAVELTTRLVDDNSELISIYYGQEATEDEANLIKKALEQKYSDIDIEVHFGGQPIYYYFISVE